jgi:ribonuclease J
VPATRDELVFLPLGGVGEIGMNLALYGYGPPDERTFLAVDFGVSFAHADLPGVDLVLPDIAYLEEERANLAGIVITHAHEDHFGALIDLWPRLRVPVFATAFTAHLLAAKLASEPQAAMVPVTVVRAGDRFTLGPFEVEYIEVAHSIPESHALAIRTPAGTVLHTGDWKIDPAPTVGPRTDERRLAELGDEGVLAMVCDSTNALREGRSPSETEVGRALAALIASARGRIGFTTFASNVGRIESIARAAAEHGRDVVVAGRAMRRVIDVAQELGMLEDLTFLEEEAFQHLPRDKVVVLLSGSQGEPRAALPRVAAGEHPRVELTRGDTMVFSARAIPGNELAIANIVNRLTRLGVHVVTGEERMVHASGHPRRDELRDMYRWVRPRIAVPVHGQPVHLAAHAGLAREMGVGKVLTIEDGVMVRLAPDPVEQVDEIDVGRLYKDGRILGRLDEIGVVERRRLAFTGHVAVAVVLDDRGEVAAEPEIALTGLPALDASGRPMAEGVRNAVNDVLDSLPRRRRRDAEVVRDAIGRAVRASIHETWGKKPLCTVFVAVV